MSKKLEVVIETDAYTVFDNGANIFLRRKGKKGVLAGVYKRNAEKYGLTSKDAIKRWADMQVYADNLAHGLVTFGGTP